MSYLPLCTGESWDSNLWIDTYKVNKSLILKKNLKHYSQSKFNSSKVMDHGFIISFQTNVKNIEI